MAVVSVNRPVCLEDAVPDDQVSIATLHKLLLRVMEDAEIAAPSQSHDDYRNRNALGRALHPLTGMSLRALITIILVAAVIATVAGGMIARTPPGEMTQYVAPISSLASLALGYWFGTDKRL